MKVLLTLVVFISIVLAAFTISVTADDASCKSCHEQCEGNRAFNLDHNNVLYTADPDYGSALPYAEICYNGGQSYQTLKYNILSGSLSEPLEEVVTSDSLNGQAGNVNGCCLCGPSTDISPNYVTVLQIVDGQKGNCSGFYYTYVDQNGAQITLPATGFNRI